MPSRRAPVVARMLIWDDCSSNVQAFKERQIARGIPERTPEEAIRPAV